MTSLDHLRIDHANGPRAPAMDVQHSTQVGLEQMNSLRWTVETLALPTRNEDLSSNTLEVRNEYSTSLIMTKKHRRWYVAREQEIQARGLAKTLFSPFKGCCTGCCTNSSASSSRPSSSSLHSSPTSQHLSTHTQDSPRLSSLLTLMQPYRGRNGYNFRYSSSSSSPSGPSSSLGGSSPNSKSMSSFSSSGPSGWHVDSSSTAPSSESPSPVQTNKPLRIGNFAAPPSSPAKSYGGKGKGHAVGSSSSTSTSSSGRKNFSHEAGPSGNTKDHHRRSQDALNISSQESAPTIPASPHSAASSSNGRLSSVSRLIESRGAFKSAVKAVKGCCMGSSCAHCPATASGSSPSTSHHTNPHPPSPATPSPSTSSSSTSSSSSGAPPIHLHYRPHGAYFYRWASSPLPSGPSSSLGGSSAHSPSFSSSGSSKWHPAVPSTAPSSPAQASPAHNTALRIDSPRPVGPSTAGEGKGKAAAAPNSSSSETSSPAGPSGTKSRRSRQVGGAIQSRGIVASAAKAIKGCCITSTTSPQHSPSSSGQHLLPASHHSPSLVQSHPPSPPASSSSSSLGAPPFQLQFRPTSQHRYGWMKFHSPPSSSLGGSSGSRSSSFSSSGSSKWHPAVPSTGPSSPRGDSPAFAHEAPLRLGGPRTAALTSAQKGKGKAVVAPSSSSSSGGSSAGPSGAKSLRRWSQQADDSFQSRGIVASAAKAIKGCCTASTTSPQHSPPTSVPSQSPLSVNPPPASALSHNASPLPPDSDPHSHSNSHHDDLYRWTPSLSGPSSNLGGSSPKSPQSMSSFTSSGPSKWYDVGTSTQPSEPFSPLHSPGTLRIGSPAAATNVGEGKGKAIAAPSPASSSSSTGAGPSGTTGHTSPVKEAR
ncbi:unnamed protein product [Sympodiomycopsis kandeliae]